MEHKFNWTRLLITVGIVVLTTVAVGGSTWYVMGEQAKKDKEATERQIQALEKQVKENSTASESVKTEGAKKDETADWKTYTDKKGKYTIKYPTSWTLDDSYFLGQDFGLTAFGKAKSDLPVPQSDQLSAITINTGKGESILNYYKTSSTVKLENVKIGANISATKVTLLPGRGTEEMYGDSKIVYYEVKVGATEYLTITQFEDYENSIFQNMLKTFSLK